jgi:hypothetical protein
MDRRHRGCRHHWLTDSAVLLLVRQHALNGLEKQVQVRSLSFAMKVWRLVHKFWALVKCTCMECCNTNRVVLFPRTPSLSSPPMQGYVNCNGGLEVLQNAAGLCLEAI